MSILSHIRFVVFVVTVGTFDGLYSIKAENIKLVKINKFDFNS